MDTAQHKVEELLADHNALSKRPMALAMFLYALEHVARIARWVPGARGQGPAWRGRMRRHS